MTKNCGLQASKSQKHFDFLKFSASLFSPKCLARTTRAGKEEISFMQVHAQHPLKSRDSGASVLLLLVVPYFPCTVFLKSS